MTTIFKGIGAGRMGQFIDEAFHDKGILSRAHRAPRADRDRGVHYHVFLAPVGNGIRHIDHFQCQLGAYSTLLPGAGVTINT